MSTATVSGLKCLVNRKAFLEAFGDAASLAPARSPKPILQNGRFDASAERGAELSATNLEVGIRRRVLGVKVDAPGSILLPASRTAGILRSMADDEVSIAADGDNILIRGLRSKFSLPSEDVSLFPEVPDFDTSKPCAEVAAADLKAGIKRTVYATDPESTRYALGGVLFEFGDSTLRLVGTDGRRLAVQEMPWEGFDPEAPQFGPAAPVVPVRALQVVDRLLSPDDAPVHVVFIGEGSIGNGVLFRLERGVVYSRLVEGRFPRYQDVFPGSDGVRVPFKVAEWLQAVQAAAQMTSEETRGVDFTFTPGVLALKTSVADVGSSEVECPHGGEGDIPPFTCDPGYLADLLKTLDADSEVDLHVVDGKSPLVFKCGGLSSVIMPLTRDR